MDRWTGVERAVAVRAFYKNGDSATAAQRIFRQHWTSWMCPICGAENISTALDVMDVSHLRMRLQLTDHSREIEQPPSSPWRKVDIQNWLTSKVIQYDENMVRTELLRYTLLPFRQDDSNVREDKCDSLRIIELELK
ncbi:Helix-turn-helix domain (DUF4817) [Popillia japonica]|uniref:Helix-turn-helix domain (DUF4817) n=1 Tax=Popillia japonica TaxID=7064 RepID=A0AAW1MY74_POPJA